MMTLQKLVVFSNIKMKMDGATNEHSGERGASKHSKQTNFYRRLSIGHAHTIIHTDPVIFLPYLEFKTRNDYFTNV